MDSDIPPDEAPEARPVQAPPPKPDLPQLEIAELAARYRRAGGPVMGLVNMVGSRVEKRIEALPDGLKDRIEGVVEGALRRSYDMAGRTLGPGGAGKGGTGERGHRAAAVATGAAGGFGGLPSAVAELPVTITLIFRAIQKIAASYGYDPADPGVRMECLQVFGAGSPLHEDDGVDTSFLGARVAITGASLNRVIAAVAPRLSIALGEKLAAQAVPLLGAVAGAGINYAFLGYYQEMAHVRFGLRRIEDQGHDRAAVRAAFRDLARTAPARR